MTEQRNGNGRTLIRKDYQRDALPLGIDMQWFANLTGPIARGANFLLSGDPGVGKSTLALQVALSAAVAGERVLIIATEQSSATLHERLDMLADPPASATAAHVDIMDDIGDLALLPQFIARHVFSRTGRYAGTGLVVIDSLHGLGNGPQDRRFYSAVFEYLRTASAAGITTFALAHMTKSREISGPRALEHAIDVSVMMRHGVSCRAIYLPKNRLGPSRTEPFAVVIDEHSTRVVSSPLTVSSCARARTLSNEGITSIEVALSIPRHERGFIKAPGLSVNEATIIVDLLSRLQLNAKSLPNLGVTIRAPGGVRFRREQSLAIAVAIAAALDRIQIPDRFIFVGDVDLRGNVMPPSTGAMRQIEELITAGVMGHSDVIVTAENESEADFDWAGCDHELVKTILDAHEFAREKTE